MKAWIVVAIVALAGCASSGELRANAYAHQRKAEVLEAHGEYDQAAHERDAARKQWRKADERAEYERTGRVF